MDPLSIKTATFKSLGCRLNQAEMDLLAFRLQSKGIRILPFGQPADLTVINTCTVTQDADRDSRHAIRQAGRKSPKGRIAVTGCYAQMSPESVRSIEGVHLVLDNSEKMNLVKILGIEDQPERQDAPVSLSASKTRANLKIQDGCDYHCSFCIIPFARGRAQGLPFRDIMREAKDLVARGFTEIVLTGVNIGTYSSQESGNPRRFADLVDEFQEVEGLKRLRISSIEPNTVTDRLLKVMKKSQVVCPYFHIPIQSASDGVLSAMRRKYRKAKLTALTGKIREQFPEAGMGTDVIVGFPGETDDRFEETLTFIESAGFSYLHVFPFSPREGTPAAKLADSIHPDVINRRVAVLRAVSDRLRTQFASRFLGRILPVLFEEPESGWQTGLTPNYLRVRLRSQQNLRGQIHNVLLEEIADDPQILSGQIAQD